MEIAAIVSVASGVYELAKLAIQAGKDAGPFFQLLVDKIGGKDPAEITQEQLDELAAESERLADELMLPLEAEEEEPVDEEPTG